MAKDAAFATLLTRETYLAGALVLEKSLRDVNTKYPFVIMATASLSQSCRDILSRKGLRIIDIDKVVLQESRLPPSFLNHDTRFVECWSKLGYALSFISSSTYLLATESSVLKNSKCAGHYHTAAENLTS
jgi:hypothetical protein